MNSKRYRFIVITRNITVLAWKHDKGVDKPRYLELMAGQLLRAQTKKRNCLLLRDGWVVLPEDGYRPHVTAPDFVIAWQTSESPEEVSLKLGRSIRKVLAWERRCRRDGVRLKRMCEA